MNPTLSAAARSSLSTYLDLIDRAVPGAASGVYLTGSAALGDWRYGRSDLDILTVTRNPLDDADLDALAALHNGLIRKPFLDAIYVYYDDLGKALDPDGPGVPYTVDGMFRRTGHLPDPVLWATLHQYGVILRGPAPSSLDVYPDQAWLQGWNLGNLDSYWRPWAAGARSRLTSREAEADVAAETITHALLGPGRLHYTIATGGILAKTASADYTAERFPAFAELLGRAKAWRLGDDSEEFKVRDALVACDLVDAVVDDAAGPADEAA